jgi:hypothetical protein
VTHLTCVMTQYVARFAATHSAYIAISLQDACHLLTPCACLSQFQGELERAPHAICFVPRLSNGNFKLYS